VIPSRFLAGLAVSCWARRFRAAKPPISILKMNVVYVLKLSGGQHPGESTTWRFSLGATFSGSKGVVDEAARAAVAEVLPTERSCLAKRPVPVRGWPLRAARGQISSSR
jgi:hypothetical protein